MPLALPKADLIKGRILLLEPRRLAARAAAERMAETWERRPKQLLRIRGQAAIKRTRIEVVTEGVLTRMLQDKPDLPGSAIIFDEFHERA